MPVAARPLTDADVARLVSPLAAVDAVRSACRDTAAGAFEVPPRIALDEGRVLVMAARHSPTSTAVVKVVSVAAGVQGLVTWTAADGVTRQLCGAGSLTALRTAAVTAVAVDAAARADASRLVVFGTGVQAAAHVRALAAVRELERVTLVGRDAIRAELCRRSLALSLAGVQVDVATDSRPALAEADLVCCATTATEPLFDLADLPDQVHVSAVGSHRSEVRELPRELLAQAQEVVVDDVAACLREAGEVVDAVRHGVLAPADLIPLPQRLASAPGAGRSVFKSVGTAAYDWAVAALVAAAADDVARAAC